MALVTDPSVELLGPFSIYNASVDVMCFHKTIYLPPPYVGVLLEKYITPAKAWRRL